MISFFLFARNDTYIIGQKEGHDMITLTLLLLAILLIIVVVICFVIASPIAIVMSLALMLDVAVLSGIFRRRRKSKGGD